MTGLRIARRRRPRRSRTADTEGGRAAAPRPTSCSTTRWSIPTRWRSRRSARRFFVGKRAGRPAIRQDAINRLMIREAQRGHRIVRLKCGDPFVFGRGGEEALALAAAGVPCEIVPGIIECACRAAARRHSGHPSRACVRVRRRVGARGGGLRAGPPVARSRQRDRRRADGHRESATRSARQLLDAGWSPRTPAAILLGASRPGAEAWHGTLEHPRGSGRVAERSARHHRRRCGRRRLPGILAPRENTEDSIPGGRVASTAT